MFAVIRLRGSTKLRHDHKLALSVLGLHKINHLALVADKDAGLVKAVADYAAYGPVDAKTLGALCEKRGRLLGNKRLTAGWLKAQKLTSFDDLGSALIANPRAYAAAGLKPVFRLGNPRKGFGEKGKKAGVAFGGSLGNWNSKINALIRAMM